MPWSLVIKSKCCILPASWSLPRRRTKQKQVKMAPEILAILVVPPSSAAVWNISNRFWKEARKNDDNNEWHQWQPSIQSGDNWWQLDTNDQLHRFNGHCVPSSSCSSTTLTLSENTGKGGGRGAGGDVEAANGMGSFRFLLKTFFIASDEIRFIVSL